MMNPDQNHMNDDEGNIFKKLNQIPGGGGVGITRNPQNSTELILGESSGDNNLSNSNESEVPSNVSQSGETNGDVNGVVSESSENTFPQSAILLRTNWGSNIYVVGTTHYSEKSQEDVARVIKAVQPNFIVLELCSSRSFMLHLNEEDMLRMSEKMDFKLMREVIRSYGVLQGIVHLLLVSVSTKLTREMGMGPGGEFRRAFKESLNIPECVVLLGDRPIEITLRRALASLSWWQSIKLVFSVLTCNTVLNEEEMEKFKNTDYLEEMLQILGGEYPTLKEIVVNERDLFLTYSLLNASMMNVGPDGHPLPNTVVGVVGLGHVAGIQKTWEAGAIHEDDIRRIFEVPPKSTTSKVIKFTIKASFLGLAIYGVYKLASEFRLIPSFRR